MNLRISMFYLFIYILNYLILIFSFRPVEQINFEELITAKLKKVMMSVELEQVTSKEV